MANDFLFAMISTKSKPTWRHSTWDGVDYMICTVIDSQKKLPVFKVGKRSLLDDDKIYLYGHDAKTVKQFTLYFHSSDTCDDLESRQSVVSNRDVVSSATTQLPGANVDT